ncbi:shikimate kinase [Kingella negevensis]|uniref:Shikimate kinase n=1 Tax=Kingella negevensis TaxID=1522312 RepID=A0A238TBY8_9NEIS|nr:shikimate kinase [Kingella negevensis]MDK4679944.1 shikimate kinase [Kingella negevensis]MDK4682337.1 shikimate kinase [Kingella negevensis]MDK4690534.1 shikimate kinase [Kingella negevensis]MDK4692118.1 shikimate kinase [Kingella negevensis]MDK4696266.1 shikimate kinase [Kingella negevensis]
MPTMKNMVGNFFLIGLMGAGKTTLGHQLADTLGYSFHDSDQEICERTGVSIPTIFEREGEQGFRLREATVIRDLCQLNNIILATGGGAVLREENQQCLKQSGTVIYLHVQPETLFERIRGDQNRPLIQVEDPLQKLQNLYTQRDPIYRRTAHIILDIELSGSLKTFNQLLESIENYAPVNR